MVVESWRQGDDSGDMVVVGIVGLGMMEVW